MEGITANDLIISTHILARRMTATPTLPRTQFYFNSHPRKEDDRYVFSILDQLQYFNSHPRKEDDDSKVVVSGNSGISTHILARRMTRFYRTTSGSVVFQLTSSQGG